MASALIGALRVNLGMDSASFERGARRSETQMQSLQRSFRQAGQSMQRAGARLSIGITAPLVAFAQQSVQAQRVQEQAVAQVNAALESMGDAAGYNLEQLQAMGSELQNRSLYGDEAILQKVTAQLLTFGNISGDVFARTQQAALDMSARLGTDLQSSAVMLGKALNDPIQGLSALSRVGVQFTDQQREQIRAMVDAGNVAAAQGLILEELEKQYGGAAAAAAGTDSGRITQAWNAIGDAMESVGAIILPIMAEFAEKVKGWAEAFQALSPETQTMIVKVGALAAAMGPLLVAAGVLTTSIGALLPVIAALASPFVLAAAAIGLVSFAIWKNWDAIKEWLALAVQFGADVIAGIADAFANGVSIIAGALSDLWASVKASLGQWVSGFYDAGVEMVQGLIDGFRSLITPDTFKIEYGVAATPGAAGIPDAVRQRAIDSGILDPQASDGAFLQGQDTGDAFADGVRESLQIRSPSRVMLEIGKFIMAGLGMGIAGGAPEATGAMADAVDQISGAAAAADFGGAVGNWEGAVASLGGTAESVFSRMGGWLVDLIKGATTLRQTLANAFAQSGSASIQAGLGGLSGALTGALGTGFGGLLSGALSGLMGFQNGGQFVVPGGGGVDSELVAFRATPGETVQITRPDQNGGAVGGVLGRIVIEEAPGFAARVQGISGNVAVETVRTYDSAMPSRVASINNDPRVR